MAEEEFAHPGCLLVMFLFVCVAVVVGGFTIGNWIVGLF